MQIPCLHLRFQVPESVIVGFRVACWQSVITSSLTEVHSGSDSNIEGSVIRAGVVQDAIYCDLSQSFWIPSSAYAVVALEL